MAQTNALAKKLGTHGIWFRHGWIEDGLVHLEISVNDKPAQIFCLAMMNRAEWEELSELIAAAEPDDEGD